jgi:hypothetical protein
MIAPSRLSIIVLLLVLAACGGPRTQGSATRSDLLTQETLRTGSQSNVYEAVQAIRPNWLRPRGPDSFRNPGQVQVYLDAVRLGGVETLRTIPVQQVQFIQWYDPVSASSRWGLDHGHGAILVSTRPL